MINTVIIEDEKKSLDVLVKLIAAHCPDLNLLGTAESVASGVELIRKHNPDLVLLDIEMADGSGFDLLEKAQGMNYDVIFTTASDQHALRAIKYSAIDYLLKPIDPEELKAAIDKFTKKRTENTSLENLKFLLQNFKKPSDNYAKITLPTGNAYEIINVKDIIRCEADGSYTSFILAGGGKKMLVSASLKHYEDLLPAEDFIRVHHHHLINIHHVVRYLKTDGGYAVMTDGSQIEISRRKKDAFLQRLQKI
ncbi:MAG: two-component system, LytT family, response regulator [Bacteroidetes bacterium]|nr:MAG: two-component system, LytT family, response regulator [Bacteroidota bacterium]